MQHTRLPPAVRDLLLLLADLYAKQQRPGNASLARGEALGAMLGMMDGR
ncbi:MAG: hypothetical protein M3R24_40700 [Chloroflexota bacterium]|nr:hypothetical protein [Chloroflexota bacterium]